VDLQKQLSEVPTVYLAPIAEHEEVVSFDPDTGAAELEEMTSATERRRTHSAAAALPPDVQNGNNFISQRVLTPTENSDCCCTIRLLCFLRSL
jgi:hypothetical protein